MRLLPVIAVIRQWTFPPAFRIKIGDADGWLESLAAGAAETMRSARELERKATEALKAAEAARTAPPPTKEKAPVPAKATPTALEPGFVISLCNDYFRVQLNAQQLEAEQGDSKELRGIRYALQNVDDLFKEHGVKCVDLSGQAYDVGRADFDPLGKPQEVPGLVRMKILRCERPLVLLNGKMIQKARGIVARPARAESVGEGHG